MNTTTMTIQTSSTPTTGVNTISRSCSNCGSMEGGKRGEGGGRRGEGGGKERGREERKGGRGGRSEGGGRRKARRIEEGRDGEKRGDWKGKERVGRTREDS